jgi:restriction system protein
MEEGGDPVAMPIPPFEDLIVPILGELSDGGQHALADLKNSLAARFRVSPSERDLRLPSTPAVRVFDNRVLWAIQHLKIAELVTSPKRAVYQLTRDGANLAAHPPSRIDRPFLVANYPKAKAYFEGISRASSATVPTAPAGAAVSPPPTAVAAEGEPPQERIEQAVEEVREKLTTDLVDRLARCDPTLFETIISRLLVKMGYAREEEDILQLHGRPGDQGIDGKVQRDPLGLEQVYVQAKRWSHPVPLRPVVDFHEEVTRSGVRKGVFVARSGFSNDAQSWIDDPDHPERRASVAWIDGARLAKLMIRYEIGVKESGSYVLQGIDENVFEPEEI